MEEHHIEDVSAMAIMTEAGSIQSLQDELRRTRVGRRWQRLYQAHRREVAALMLVHPEVRSHVDDALGLFCAATATRAVDEATLRAASRVLDDLSRFGTNELRSTVSGLREDVACAKGQSLDELLGD